MYLRETDAPHSVDQDVEWLYAFDVHCNAFFPLFVLLYVVQVQSHTDKQNPAQTCSLIQLVHVSGPQYILLPFLLNGSFIACLVGNTLYLAATGYYFYFTFLGYMSTLPVDVLTNHSSNQPGPHTSAPRLASKTTVLPFLDRTRTNVFLYPIAAAVVVYIIALIARVSASSVVLGLYLA